MNKLQRYVIAAIITAIVLFLVWFFSDIVKYILVSVMLSLMGKPLVDVLCRIKYKNIIFPKWLAATITLIVLWGIVIGAALIFVPLLVNKIQAFTSHNFSEMIDYLNVWSSSIEELLLTRFSIDLNASGVSIFESIDGKLGDIFNPEKLSLVISSAINSISWIVVAAFSISFITFFFLKESDLFNEGMMILFPKKYEDNIRRALKSSVELLSRYFIGLLVESVIKLITVSVSLYIVGVPFSDALIIALISAILNVIPYIGPLLGAAIGILIGIATPISGIGMDSLIINMIVIFSAFQIVDNVIIQPYVYSSSVKAHPLEIFIVILMAGAVAGITGMLLAIPAYTVLRVFAKEFFNKLRLVQKLTEKI